MRRASPARQRVMHYSNADLYCVPHLLVIKPRQKGRFFVATWVMQEAASPLRAWNVAPDIISLLDLDRTCVRRPFNHVKENRMAKRAAKKKTAKKKPSRRPFTKEDVKTLRAHSKARTPVAKIARELKRTEGSLRQKAIKLGIGLGHQR